MSGRSLNTGIISVLFASSVIWWSVHHICIHRESFTSLQLLGINLIITSVLVISFDYEINGTNKVFFISALVFGLLTGLAHAINLITL
jgi:hypothetical protein